MLSNKNTMKKVNRLILNNILLVASIIIVINVLSSFYNNTKKIVNNNILNNVNETAEHDLKNINSYIGSVWDNLTYISGRIKEYDF